MMEMDMQTLKQASQVAWTIDLFDCDCGIPLIKLVL